ncbi:hypothetical protein HDV63DRAFT_366032 [Trichoderma sp. SZMC 28014]
MTMSLPLFILCGTATLWQCTARSHRKSHNETFCSRYFYVIGNFSELKTCMNVSDWMKVYTCLSTRRGIWKSA